MSHLLLNTYLWSEIDNVLMQGHERYEHERHERYEHERHERYEDENIMK